MTGLLRPITCNQSGIVWTGAKTELMKVNGNSQTNPAV